jgi:hypothetical protein
MRYLGRRRFLRIFRDAWKRYAAAKGDNWRAAFAEWAEAREATLAAYLDEAARWPR